MIGNIYTPLYIRIILDMTAYIWYTIYSITTRDSVMRIIVLICMLCISTHTLANTPTHRSTTTPRQFMRLHPCPSTGHTYGACPGWIRDHIIPLCAGGRDTVANMQWQEYKASIEKDKLEWKQCRQLRKHKR